jgi:hypothetical protein
MTALIPDEALQQVGVIAPIDGLAAAIRARYGDRVQRVGFYSLGSALMDDHDALKQVIGELQA